MLVTVYIIEVMPLVIPVTKPVPETVATDGVALLQVPPDAVSMNVNVSPGQRLSIPVITPGLGIVIMWM